MKPQVKQLRGLAREPAANAFFGWLSGYVRNTESSSVGQAEREATRWGRDNLDKQFTVTRSEVIAIMRKLDELSLGRFIVGRRGAESRIEFWTSRSQIGQVALGQSDSLEVYEAPVELESDELLASHRMLIANALRIPIGAVSIRLRDTA